ncbi:MAG: sugar phosphate isomerase/epimerase family protein, partial [Acutalibacteraceae bacterium]
NPADYREEVIERLGKFLDLAKGTGITLCHENEKGIYGDIPERCLEIHRALPQMPAIFDPANYIQCGADTLEGWKMLSGYVKYLHIKDALADGSVVPAGKGVGNLPFILDDFRKNGGKCVTIEPHLTVFEGLSALEKEGDKSVVGEVYRYPSTTAAFKAAADALKELI